MTGSRREVMIAAGAVPLWMDSRSTPLPEHDPRPEGINQHPAAG